MLKEVIVIYTEEEVKEKLGKYIGVKFTDAYLGEEELVGDLWDRTMDVFKREVFDRLSVEEKAELGEVSNLEASIKVSGASMFRTTDKVPVEVSYSLEI